MGVEEILARKGSKVITVATDASVHEVSKLLAKNKIGAVVVLDGSGKVCGIVSERDLVRQIADGGDAALKKPISECMTAKVISCAPNESVDSLMDKMTKGRFRHLPVIDGDKLAGIISIGDVVKRKIESAEQEAEEMKRYIAG